MIRRRMITISTEYAVALNVNEINIMEMKCLRGVVSVHMCHVHLKWA